MLYKYFGINHSIEAVFVLVVQETRAPQLFPPLFFFVAFLIQKHSFKTVPASVLAFNKCQTEGRLTLERGVTGQGRFLFVSLGSLLCCSLIFFMVWHTTRGKLLPSPHLLCYEAFRFSQGKNASWKPLFLRKLPSYSLQ